jgi:hypothetical protein
VVDMAYKYRESAFRAIFPVEETNQVIKMLSNYSTAAVTLLLALGVDKGLQLGYTEI